MAEINKACHCVVKEEKYLTALYGFTPLGTQRLLKMRQILGSYEAVWKLSAGELCSIGLRANLSHRFINYINNFDIDNYFYRLKKLQISVVTINSRNYPQLLKSIQDPPLVLYVKGKLPERDKTLVAIVGSRYMTHYGKEITERFSGELAESGVVVVSGLARGIDTVAHRVALTSHGTTIAVLASGLDIIYPPENSRLANEITRSGALISEFPLGYKIQKYNFSSRNRIISGLSKAVVVIEGKYRSGTLITARHAAEQGREVFAVPGQITSPLSQAPLYLLQNGAKLVTSGKDILDLLGIEGVKRKTSDNQLTEQQGQILKVLENEPRQLDEVAKILSVNIAAIAGELSFLEIQGLVINIGSSVYKRSY